MAQADFTVHVVGNDVIPVGESGVEFFGVFFAGGEFCLVLVLFPLVFLFDLLALGLDCRFFRGFFAGLLVLRGRLGFFVAGFSLASSAFSAGLAASLASADFSSALLAPLASADFTSGLAASFDSAAGLFSASALASGKGSNFGFAMASGLNSAITNK